jgi:hypothetical protein
VWHRRGGGWCGVEIDVEDERSVRRRHGGGWHGVQAHGEEERSVRERRGGGRRGGRHGGVVGEAPAWRQSLRR